MSRDGAPRALTPSAPRSVLGQVARAFVGPDEENERRIAELEESLAAERTCSAAERERAAAEAATERERAATAVNLAAERVRDAAIAERKMLDYYDVVRAFEVQRDEWKGMFVTQTITNANAQAHLEGVVEQAVGAFNRALIELNAHRREKGLPEVKPAEFVPTVSAAFRREMKEMQDQAMPLLSADEAQAKMRAASEVDVGEAVVVSPAGGEVDVGEAVVVSPAGGEVDVGETSEVYPAVVGGVA